MAKKLYEVTAKFYVMADNELGAEYPYSFELSNCTLDVFEAQSVDADWWDSIPFGGDDDRTCGQIFEQRKADIEAASGVGISGSKKEQSHGCC
jgi:hypothetical protein